MQCLSKNKYIFQIRVQKNCLANNIYRNRRVPRQNKLPLNKLLRTQSFYLLRRYVLDNVIMF